MLEISGRLSGRVPNISGRANGPLNGQLNGGVGGRSSSEPATHRPSHYRGCLGGRKWRLRKARVNGILSVERTRGAAATCTHYHLGPALRSASVTILGAPVGRHACVENISGRRSLWALEIPGVTHIMLVRGMQASVLTRLKRPRADQANEIWPPHTRVLGLLLTITPTITRLKRSRADQANDIWPPHIRVLGLLLGFKKE